MSNATATYRFPAHILAAVAEFAAKKDRRAFLNGVVLCPNALIGTSGSILAFGTDNVTHEGHPDPVLLSNDTVKNILRDADKRVVITVRVREADLHPDVDVSKLPKGTRFLRKPPSLEVQYDVPKKGSPAVVQMMGMEYYTTLPPYENVVPSSLTPENLTGYGLNMEDLIVLGNARKALRKFGVAGMISFQIEDAGKGPTPWRMMLGKSGSKEFHPLGLAGVLMPVNDSFDRGTITVV